MKRRAVEIDRDYDKLLAMYRLSWGINFPGLEFREPSFRSWLASGVLHNTMYTYELEGEVVGWLWLDLSPHHVAHIVHVQVDEGHWGQGLGRKIIEDAIALAMEEGREALTLAVTKSNARAMALYRHFGFVVTEQEVGRQRMRLELDGV